MYGHVGCVRVQGLHGVIEGQLFTGQLTGGHDRHESGSFMGVFKQVGEGHTGQGDAMAGLGFGFGGGSGQSMEGQVVATGTGTATISKEG